jgi:hypothetical protein
MPEKERKEKLKGALKAKPYPGDLKVPLTPLQEMSLEAMERHVAEGFPLSDAARASLLEMLQQGPGFPEEYFQTNIAAPMLELLEEKLMPRVRRRAAATGTFYSEQRRKTEKELGEDLLEALTAARSRLAYQSFDRFMRALGMTPSIEAAPVTTLAQAFGVGETARRVGRENILTEYQDWLRQQAGSPKANQLLAALGLRAVSPYMTVAPPQPGFLQTLLPYAGMALGNLAGTEAFANWLFSGSTGTTAAGVSPYAAADSAASIGAFF